MATKRIPLKAVGSVVVFKGFDGKDYTAHIDKVAHGVAVILYFVNGQQVRSYIQDRSRLIGI